MSNFIYNSYCVVPVGTHKTLTQAYRPQADAPVARAPHNYSFLWASAIMLTVLLAVASTDDGAAVAVGMLVWLLALVGWGLNQPVVRRALLTVRQGVRAWRQSRRQMAEDERTWHMAMQDARMMADLSRAMDAQTLPR